MTYRALLLHFLNIDYVTCAVKDLVALAHTHQLGLPPGALLWDKDTLLQLLMSTLVEPQLGIGELFILTHFPTTQAALSKVERTKEGEEVGLRFEVYARGIELANGYEELTDAKEQERRLREANAIRIDAGKEGLPLDERFIEALRVGLPACCGVAVGFDRLLQLHLQLNSIQPVLALPWEGV
jgi:lysyl-tRNA synthetase class 2